VIPGETACDWVRRYERPEYIADTCQHTQTHIDNLTPSRRTDTVKINSNNNNNNRHHHYHHHKMYFCWW